MSWNKALRIRFRLIGPGWCQAALSDGENSITLESSRLSDGPLSLTEAVIALLQSADRIAFVWAEEPGEYRWLLEKQGDKLHVRILWFDQTFSRLMDEKWRLLFEVNCDLRRFATQWHGQLAQVLHESGTERYREQWRHDFPSTEYERRVRLTRRNKNGGLNVS